ncbi:MAG: ATP-binding protein [Campylobacterota bacterium]
MGSQLTYLQAKAKSQGDSSEDEAFHRLKSINKEINTILEDVHKLYKKEDSKTKFDIQKPIEHSLTLLSTQIIKNQIEVNIKQSKSIQMYGYPNTLSHIFIIIIENAIDIFKQREIEKPILDIDYYKDNGNIVIKVCDNAKGVDKKDLESIFELYFSKKQGGTGIGLALAKKLVESKLHGVIFANNSNQGLNLHISLPLWLN